MSNWQTTSAPKDCPVLACFGDPWVSVAVWNAASNSWAVAQYEVDFYEGQCQDTYFSTEYFKEDQLTAWMPLPPLFDA